MKFALNRLDMVTPMRFAASASRAESLGWDMGLIPVNPLLGSTVVPRSNEEEVSVAQYKVKANATGILVAVEAVKKASSTRGSVAAAGLTFGAARKGKKTELKKVNTENWEIPDFPLRCV